MTRIIMIVGLALGCVVWIAPGAMAQSTSNVAAADALFEEGVALRKKGQHKEACEKFKRSLSLDPGRGTLQNIGLCLEQQGAVASALTTFQSLLDQAEGAGDTERIQYARKKLKKLKKRVPHLLIVVGTEVQVDRLEIVRDQEVIPGALWNLSAPIDPGTYTITARAPNHEPWTTQIKIQERQKAKVDVPRLSASPVRPVPVEPPTIETSDDSVVAENSVTTPVDATAVTTTTPRVIGMAEPPGPAPRFRIAILGGLVTGLKGHSDEPSLGLAGQVAYRLLDDGATSVALGAEGTFTHIIWDSEMFTGTTSRYGFLLNATVSRNINLKTRIYVQAGAGLLVLTGLENLDHPLVDPTQPVDGAVSLLNLSGSVGMSADIAKKLSMLVHSTIRYSPPRDSMPDSVGYLATIEIMFGLLYRLQ